MIGLGSNLGLCLETLREAVARIGQVTRVVARSSVWRTAPVGGPAQPDYSNAAVLVETTLSPLELLDETAKIEAELGRVRDVPDGPRTIDLDLLWIDALVVNEPRLVVPHPRLHLRAFALAPMLEVAPDALDPRTGRPYVVPPDEGVWRTSEML